MKIAYIGSFKRLYDEEGIARSLEHMGHTVRRYSEDTLEVSQLDQLLTGKPDIILFAKLKLPLRDREYLIRSAKVLKIKTVCWMPDLYFGLGRQWRLDEGDPMFKADLVCTPDGGHDQEWKERKINHRLLRQGIFHEEIYQGTPTILPYDIVFVGSHNGEFRYRDTLMKQLRTRYGKRFHWIGRDYSHEVRGSALNDLFASVKIVIGDSVHSPHYWSNRIYETLGRGGFLIHPNIAGLEKEFRYFKHFIPYDYGDFEGLFQKIDYYLNHPEQRAKIAADGQQYVDDHHTLLHRCQQLMEYIKEL